MIRQKRTKNIKLPFSPPKASLDDNLILIQLQKIDKCAQEISNNNLDRAWQLIHQINNDGQMISKDNPQKAIIRCLSLNLQAFYLQKRTRYKQALDCLQFSRQIQNKQGLSNADKARTLLNTCVIYDLLGKHEEAVNLAKQALQMLNIKDHIPFGGQANQYKRHQILAATFYNIATSLQHLGKNNEALKVYKQGFYLAQRVLGPNHKLSILLRSIIKTNRINNSHKKIQQISPSKSQRYIDMLSKSPRQKQQILKQIYRSKPKKYSIDLKSSNNSSIHERHNLTKLRKSLQLKKRTKTQTSNKKHFKRYNKKQTKSPQDILLQTDFKLPTISKRQQQSTKISNKTDQNIKNIQFNKIQNEFQQMAQKIGERVKKQEGSCQLI